jgi:RHS repeat-associated protein
MTSFFRQLLAAILSLAVCIPTYGFAVGNRKQITSTLAPVPAGLWNYDANDRFTAGDTYDANGNTVISGGIGNVYDFENHLIQKAGVNIVYDGDGNRVQKTVAGVTTKYLVDTQNPTGYAQVVYETITGNTTQPFDSARTYVYGLELISKYRQFVANNQGQTQISYYVYDGHGSVRALTSTTGVVTDTYDYDAFGNLIHQTGSTPNNYLFAGEQFDPDLGLYYNRARYLNTNTGRFWSMDSYEGDSASPISLHKYLYTGDEPVDRSDPTGRDFGLADAAIAGAIANTINAIEANVGTSVLQGLQCEQEGTCKSGTTGALFDLAFTAVAATVVIEAFAVAGKVVERLPLRFSQIEASVRFQKGGPFEFQTIGAIAAKLRSGFISPSALPVQYIVRGGTRLIVNTRSSLALMRAGVPESAWVLIDMTGDLEVESAITKRLAYNGLTDGGTDVLRITGLGQTASNLQ